MECFIKLLSWLKYILQRVRRKRVRLSALREDKLITRAPKSISCPLITMGVNSSETSCSERVVYKQVSLCGEQNRLCLGNVFASGWG